MEKTQAQKAQNEEGQEEERQKEQERHKKEEGDRAWLGFLLSSARSLMPALRPSPSQFAPSSVYDYASLWDRSSALGLGTGRKMILLRCAAPLQFMHSP